ncbi:SUMO-specific isopeptidase USPL1 isoform X2 [Tyto alba]|uniref:SUMO-specific isopeptidase USPL1 isoform X2 n=1 Tax=Tyto alba TaxID=56313 RepID=UPI001C684F4F|nr:SUMO-specific isopeptidase USPL1 isoform X2 [Tyto alba]XP_032838688.2 SUMO-specific isopeptidase USPL1 isoform X2 [Tyto alba]XP_032838689.2 SUMO-specific isopeptidase USPL1 isoform X2 [Tyto alba]
MGVVQSAKRRARSNFYGLTALIFKSPFFFVKILRCESPFSLLQVWCIYPLGYKPLNSIITSADSENHQVPSTQKKRKLCDIGDFSAVESHPKKSRTNNVVSVEHTVDADSVVKCSQNSLCIPRSSLHDVLQNDQQKPINGVKSCMQKLDFETTPNTNSYQESPPKTSSPAIQLLPNSELCSTTSEILLRDGEDSTSNTDFCLQWRNVHNLCWLDCILSALVRLETLKFALAEEYNNGKCLLQKLLTKYNQATVLLNTCKRSKVKDVLPKAESHLNEIRNRMFTQLQPQLKCELGMKESPVFALPLILKLDQQAEKLFLHSFSWKFECVCCGYKYQERSRKTLTTFTNIIPGWHPLNAIHVGPCNNCGDRSQRRQMILEKVPSILMFHFVEGLPHNNLKNYSFQFEEDTYQITSIVQYQTDKKHFITWSLNPDGTWLECDDLKGPYCKRHKRFEVLPSEIHIVIWEKKTSHVPEKLNSQFQGKNIEDFPLNNVQSNSTVLNCGFDNTVDNIPAEHHKEDSVRTPDKKQQRVGEDESVVDYGLENLAHNDLVTLMLEEIQVDSEEKSLLNGQMVGNNLVVEMGTPQQQESASSPNTLYTGECSGTSLAMNSTCMLYENSSICLPLEELNLANTTPPVPKTHNPDPSDSSFAHAQRTDDRTKLPNREHGLNSELQLNKKLSPVEDIIQKSPGLKDASKTVVNSQVANSSAANNSFQPSHKDQKRGFVGSWVKKLLSKNTSFMPSSASALKNERSCKTPSMQKMSEVRLPVKRASNFGGFQSRSTNKASETPKSVVPQSNNAHPLSNFKGFSRTCLPTASHTTITGTTWNKPGSTSGISGKVTQFQSPSCNSGKAEESDSDKTKKLRLKLLKKLNAKKKKLASLDRLAVEQMKLEKPVSGDVSTLSQTDSHNDSELLQSFLRELQYQIDGADNESEFNASSVSGCTSHNNSDEILAELLSPTSTVASLEAPKSEDECMYMEMVDSSVAMMASDEKTSVPRAAMTSEDHNYYSPVKDSNSEPHTVNKPSVKKLAFESPTREDILEDLFSISAPSSMAGDIDLPHFDETLFETW